MAIVVQIIGVVLALSGLIGLVYGIDLLPTERGVAGTISSTVALSAGILVSALGVVIQRLDGLQAALGGSVPALPRPKAPQNAPQNARKPNAEDRPLRLDPPMAQEPEPIVAPEARLPEIRLPEIRLPPIVPEPPKPESAAPLVEPVVEAKQKFKLPSFKIGAGAAAAGVVAGAALAKAGDLASEARDAVVEKAADVVAASTSLAKPDPVDPPVEVLTPVLDAPEEPVLDLSEPLLPPVDAAAYAEVPMPEAAPAAVPEPASAPAPEDDPFAAFDAELDRLIPLKSGKKAKDKAKKDAEPAAPVAPVLPEPVVAETVTEPAETVPAQVYADPADLVPPPPSPAPGAEIVGAYESGGAKYTMYSDGSVIAEAEGQQLFFKSLEELREFIDGGPKA